MAAENETLTLRSKDGETFEISQKAAELSTVIKDSMEDDSNDTFEAMRVHSVCLKKVVEFLKHYESEAMDDIPTPLGGTKFEEIVKQDWYRDFVGTEDRDVIFDLLTAANYLGIKPLLDLACLKVTFMLTGKSAEDIRQILKLPELTPEEDAKARKDHKWIFEDA